MSEMKIPDAGAFRISASAGSGKTYSLTRLFLTRMLRDRNAFRGMLAITFTNKAANELRDRILKRLRSLADARQKEKDLFGFSDRESLARRAGEVLETVLHHSEFLQVGTIDSFFQQVFASLAVELGLPPGLKTELDLSSVKKEILEEILRRRDPEMMHILVENLSLQLEESGKDWRPVPYLRKKVLDAIFEEPVVSLFLNSRTEELSEEKLSRAGGILRDFVKAIENEIRDSAKELASKMESFGIRPGDFDRQAEKNFVNEIERVWKAADGNFIPDPSATQINKGEFYYKSKTRKFTAAELEELRPLILRFGASRSPRILANHKLAVYLLRHLISIRLLVFFRRMLQEQNRNQNRFLLNEVKYLLAGFLDSTEVPYLFEKTGSRLHTLLIDEFQDTDHTQWRVLRSLAQVVVENDGLFAVVGDVKQSIYGWRGADSSLFKAGMNQDLKPVQIEEASLLCNYRSEALIVEFNNWLFSSLSSDYAGRLLDCGQVIDSSRWQETIRLNYADVKQSSEAANAGRRDGFVEVRVRPKQQGASRADGDEDEEETASGFDWLPAEIMRLQDAGFKASDIAVLVRRNSDAAAAIRVLDKAARTGNPDYDFSFSTAASGKAGDQALFSFLMLCLRRSAGYKITPFETEELACLAACLGLSGEFEQTGWQERWLRNPFREREPDAAFLEQVRYFGLDQLPDHQQLLVQFQEMLAAYLREDSIQYPDFFAWWQHKGSEQEVPLGGGSNGITVMTIHRSKGLDFGVVILPLVSTGTGDSKALHDAAFWISGEESPWNSHALLRGRAQKSLLESDLGASYQEDVFRRAVEALNTYYVACTRPRYGLIIDISLQGNLEKPETASYRLPYQTAWLLKEGKVPFAEDDYSLETDAGGLLLRFSMGKPALVKEEDKEPSGGLREGARFLARYEGCQPLQAGALSPLPVRVGILVHEILEKTQKAGEWKELLALAEGWNEAEKKEAAQALVNLFNSAEMNEWFSEKWQAFPELELLTSGGRLLRSDRILVKEKESVILDFKTGAEEEGHLAQILEYKVAFEEASGKKASAWLVYSQTGSIVKAA